MLFLMSAIEKNLPKRSVDVHEMRLVGSQRTVFKLVVDKPPSRNKHFDKLESIAEVRVTFELLSKR